MAEIKYTSDGKKVVVLGALNSTEKIVQEIYIVDGSEIPSGEHFVTKTLHDAPAVSWKEKNLKELEERYEKRKRELENAIEEQEKRLADRRRELEAHLRYAAKVLKGVSEESFEMLVALLTGQIKWIVDPCFFNPKILPFSSEIWDQTEKEFRLLSLFGCDDGSFTFRINRWRDGSGSNTDLIPCKTHEEAVEVLRKVVSEKKEIRENYFALAEKYGFELPADKVAQYKETQRANLKKQLDECEARQKLLSDQISKL